MNDAKSDNAGSNAANPYYNFSALETITSVQKNPVSFSRLFGLRRGPGMAGRENDDALASTEEGRPSYTGN